MYVPSSFAETDPAELHAFIRSNSFGILTSMVAGELFATHLPLMLDTPGANVRLVGHFARANPQWQELEGQNVLVVFPGPHTYVSPSWYESENVVPTWNYVAVHAYGTCRLMTDPAELHALLQRMIDTYERSMPKPWSLTDDAYLEKMAKQVVGFTIDVRRLEGKWKLNQNHPRERREKVMRVLADSSHADGREIAALMEASLAKAPK
jgi:transcriptional regulator